MRLKILIWSAMFVLLLVPAVAPRAAAQNAETMLPEASATKAKQLLQQLLDALGGPAYLRAREVLCTGRLAQFGHNGDLIGYQHFKDFWRYPDKNRTEYGKKGEIVDLFAGDQGWTLDKGGVSEVPAGRVSDFQEQVKKDIDNLLRGRLKEDGMIFRYGGPGIEDLKPVDWVELVDSGRRTFRIAIERSSHLMVRGLVIIRDTTTRERTEELTVYSNYHLLDGVMTPLQVEREHDGRRVYQVFYESCQVNPNFPDELFTKASLEKRYSEVGKKKKNKDTDKD